jgi:membrane-bound lytic murein transglycosylase
LKDILEDLSALELELPGLERSAEAACRPRCGYGVPCPYESEPEPVVDLFEQVPCAHKNRQQALFQQPRQMEVESSGAPLFKYIEKQKNIYNGPNIKVQSEQLPAVLQQTEDMVQRFSSQFAPRKQKPSKPAVSPFEVEIQQPVIEVQPEELYPRGYYRRSFRGGRRHRFSDYPSIF